jgi:hypothetical protein
MRQGRLESGHSSLRAAQLRASTLLPNCSPRLHGAPRYLTALPLLWALVGSTAVIALGMWEDLGLLVSAVVGTALILLRGRASSHTTSGTLRPLAHA